MEMSCFSIVFKLEDTVEKKEQLMAQQDIAAASDANRKRFLNQEMNDAIDLAVKLQDEDGYFGEWEELFVHSRTDQLKFLLFCSCDMYYDD